MKHYFTRLQEQIREHWDAPALSDYKGESFTFGDLAAHIEKFHIFFESAGVKRGDKIAICARNSARWAVSFLAANTYEAVTVPILSDFHPVLFFRRASRLHTLKWRYSPHPFPDSVSRQGTHKR